MNSSQPLETSWGSRFLKNFQGVTPPQLPHHFFSSTRQNMGPQRPPIDIRQMSSMGAFGNPQGGRKHWGPVARPKGVQAHWPVGVENASNFFSSYWHRRLCYNHCVLCGVLSGANIEESYVFSFCGRLARVCNFWGW